MEMPLSDQRTAFPADAKQRWKTAQEAIRILTDKSKEGLRESSENQQPINIFVIKLFGQ
jgi:hypothetical protein